MVVCQKYTICTIYNNKHFIQKLMTNFSQFIQDHLTEILNFFKLLLYSLLAAGVRVIFSPPQTFKQKVIMYFGGVFVGLIVGRICSELGYNSGLSYALSSFSAISWREIVEFLIRTAKDPMKFLNQYIRFINEQKKTEDNDK